MRTGTFASPGRRPRAPRRLDQARSRSWHSPGRAFTRPGPPAYHPRGRAAITQPREGGRPPRPTVTEPQARARANHYERDLDRGPANHVPLSPLSFLARAATVYADKPAVIHGDSSFTYAQLYARCRRLASALRRRRIGRGDTVAVMAPNVPAMLEAHYGVPMAGAVLNPLNYRLDARSIAFMLEHAGTRVLITDREFSDTIGQALGTLRRRLTVIDIDDPLHEGGTLLGEKDYEAFLEEGDPEYAWRGPADEWQGISLLYTSGTTGNPKGVVYAHRGAYLHALRSEERRVGEERR